MVLLALRRVKLEGLWLMRGKKLSCATQLADGHAKLERRLGGF